MCWVYLLLVYFVLTWSLPRETYLGWYVRAVYIVNCVLAMLTNNMFISSTADSTNLKAKFGWNWMNVVSVWRGFLFLWVLGMGYVILLLHSPEPFM